VPIPVSDQDVHQPGAKVGARVDSFVAAPLQALEEGDRVGDLGRTFETVFDPLFDEPEHARVRMELPKARIVGQDRPLWPRVEDASGLEQGRGDQSSARVRRARLVPEVVAHDRVSRVGIQAAGGILIDRSERPHVSISALEVQALRLEPPAETVGAEASVEEFQVQHGDFDRGLPRVAPMSAEEEAAEPSSP